MEAMLPKSLGTSDSEIQGVIVCQWWIPRGWVQAEGLQPPRGGAAFISKEFTIDTLWLLGFLSLMCQRTEATLHPYCSVASVFADYFRLFLYVIHTYNYHNILGFGFSWCVQYLQDTSEWNRSYWYLSTNTCEVCYSRRQFDFPQIIISMKIFF